MSAERPRHRPSPEELDAAWARVREHAHRTPVLTSRTMDERAGAQLFFKCENLQRGGAFKFRGASNAVFGLSDADAARGVATHSSGNHAQALAIAARMRGVPAHIVMPEDAPAAKRAAVIGYGGQVTTCAPTLEARETTLDAVVAETGATFVHPYDDTRVIAGQSTTSRELMEQVPDLDRIVVPVGGGGLACGSVLAAAAFFPHVTVSGVEPALADDAHRGLAKGERQGPRPPVTVADGLRTALSDLTFGILRDAQLAIELADEDAIVAATRLVWERMKIVIEPSAAVAVAVALRGTYAGERVGVVLSGGNLDLDRLPWLR